LASTQKLIWQTRRMCWTSLFCTVRLVPEVGMRNFFFMSAIAIWPIEGRISATPYSQLINVATQLHICNYAINCGYAE
jgi:hypothetical protein